jgi:hypothetical protein
VADSVSVLVWSTVWPFVPDAHQPEQLLNPHLAVPSRMTPITVNAALVWRILLIFNIGVALASTWTGFAKGEGPSGVDACAPNL